MPVSWFMQAQQFKSPNHVIAAFLLKSREHHKLKNKELQQENKQLQTELQAQNRIHLKQKKQMKSLQRQLQKMQTHSENQAITLPVDPPVGQHGYGARMISLMVNLAQQVGLRATEKVTHLFFQFFNIMEKVPHWTSIRTWMQRIGIAKTEEPVEVADDWIWMADHSNQIGQEKALVVLGIRSSDMPEPGHAIAHQHVRPLLVEPGISWKKEDMIILRDFKHNAANVMKSLIGNTASFKEFSSQVGRTRSAVQQTELAHLTPPVSKSKSRFMNLASMLRWAGMVSWVLDTPGSSGRIGITTERLEEKFGRSVSVSYRNR